MKFFKKKHKRCFLLKPAYQETQTFKSLDVIWTNIEQYFTKIQEKPARRTGYVTYNFWNKPEFIRFNISGGLHQLIVSDAEAFELSKVLMIGRPVKLKYGIISKKLPSRANLRFFELHGHLDGLTIAVAEFATKNSADKFLPYDFFEAEINNTAAIEDWNLALISSLKDLRLETKPIQ